LARAKGRRLLDLESELETILNGIGDGFYSVDRHWRVRRFNPEASRHFGRPAQVMFDRPLWDAFPQAVDTDLGRVFFRTMARRETVRSEAQSVTVGPRWLDYRLFPVGDGMGVAFRDITDHKNAEREGSFPGADANAAIVDRLSFGIVQLSTRGHLVSANRAAYGISCSDDGLTIQETLRATFGPDDARLQVAIGKACAATAASGRQVGEQLRISRRSARRPYVVFVVSLANDRLFSRPPGAVVVITDPDIQCPIDEQKLMEAFGFTPAEARLVAQLVTGQALPDIAKCLGISFETARTHLARARAKTDTASQLDLVRLVLTTVSPLSLMSL
jgi:PAS domain-containing protein/DNA-binding CsgD family transcriptional regulator